MVNYGTDASEHFIGWEGFKQAVEKMLPSFEKIKIAVHDQVIQVHTSGNVAWFSQIWDWDMVIEGKPASSHGCRFTGVLEKRSDRWVIVQFHNSVPVQ